jgi:hypothetical protein
MDGGIGVEKKTKKPKRLYIKIAGQAGLLLHPDGRRVLEELAPSAKFPSRPRP